jgi:multiple sugar transport system permease protein
MSRRKIGAYVGIYLCYAVIAIVFLGPVVFMLWGSLRRDVDITASPPRWLATLSLQNYIHLFQGLQFGRYVLNSCIVAGGSTLLGLVAGVPAAFVLVRFRLRGLAFFTLVARMAPGVLFLIPLYLVAVKIGALASEPLDYVMLVLAHLIITLPLALWLLVPYFEGIPIEIEEAAMLDGCTLWERFRRVTLPLTLPGLSVALTFCFIFSWNYFLFALALATPSTVTLPVIAFNFIGVGQADWGGLMAAAVIIAAPAVLLTILAQRLLVRGLTVGAVK